MDKRKIEILKIIDESKNKKAPVSVDYESLGREGYDKSLLRVMISEELIGWSGVDFYLTDKGEKTLQNYLLIKGFKKPEKTLGIMFDSNAFDDLVNGNLSIKDLEKARGQGYEFYITHIQTDEMNDCSDTEKRKKLDLFKTKIRPVLIETESSVLGLSRSNFARYSDGKILNRLRNNSNNIKKSKDALIGETAIINNLVLLTNDINFRKKVEALGGTVKNLEEFKEMLK